MEQATSGYFIAMASCASGQDEANPGSNWLTEQARKEIEQIIFD